MNDIDKAFAEYCQTVTDIVKAETKFNVIFASIIFISIIAMLCFCMVIT